MAGLSAKLLGLIPSVVAKKPVQLDEVAEIYTSDLPSPGTVKSEELRWKLKWQRTPEELRPTSLAKTIKQCDSDEYPNIFTLLKIACTLPITSCECERSFSALRRLDTYLRHTMKEKRLSALALIHIHYDFPVDIAQAVNIFYNLHKRRLQIESVL